MKIGDKTWATLDETTLQKAGTAWHWLHEYMDDKSGRGNGLPEGTKIADAMMSKFVPPCVILKHLPENMVVASLGNRTWGALGLPLCQIHSEDGAPDDVYYSFVSNPAAGTGGSTPSRRTIGLLCHTWPTVAPPTALS